MSASLTVVIIAGSAFLGSLIGTLRQAQRTRGWGNPLEWAVFVVAVIVAVFLGLVGVIPSAYVIAGLAGSAASLAGWLAGKTIRAQTHTVTR